MVRLGVHDHQNRRSRSPEYAKGNGPLKNAKNGRKLHIIAIENGEPVYYECRAIDRHLMPREMLAAVTPDTELFFPEESLKILRQWLANRYSRTAFPNNFNLRLRIKQKELDSIFTASADDASGFLISLS